MSKLKHQLPKHILKTIYFSLVESHLRFGILAWGDSPPSQIHRLIVLQKKALRILTNSKKKSHTSHLFGNQEILKFEDLYKLNVIKFVREYQYGECPLYFCDTLNTNVSLHSYNTRQSFNFHRESIDLKLQEQTISFKLTNIWNIQPNSIKIKITDLNKKKYIQFVKEQYISNYFNFVCSKKNYYSCQQ